MSSRGTWRSRSFREGKAKARLLRRLAMTKLSCHREERGDLGLSERARQKRDCFAGSPLCVIERNEAISPFRGWETEKREIASQARNDKIILSSRGTKRSRLSGAGKQKKERLLRRLAMTKYKNGDDKIEKFATGKTNQGCRFGSPEPKTKTLSAYPAG